MWRARRLFVFDKYILLILILSGADGVVMGTRVSYNTG